MALNAIYQITSSMWLHFLHRITRNFVSLVLQKGNYGKKRPGDMPRVSHKVCD